MKLTKLAWTMATVIGASVAADALALELYVDTKTQQIFAEPGKGRVKLGTFERVEDTLTAHPDTAKQKIDATQQAEIDKIKEDLALKNNELKALDEHINDPSLGHLHMDEKGVKFESKDGNFEMQITGRLQVDAQMNVDGQQSIAAAKNSVSSTSSFGKNGALLPNTTVGNTTNSLADGANIRRARIGVEGSYYKDFGYKFEYDFARGNGLSGGITDAFLTYKGYEPLTLTVGQYKEFFTLEETTSNRYLTFIERNMAVNAFSDNNNPYKVGLGLSYAQPRWTGSVGIQTESMGNGSPTFDSSSTNANWNVNRNNGSGDTGYGYTGRFTALPWFEDKTKFLHVGVSGSQRNINTNYNSDGSLATNGAGLRFGSAIDTNVDRTLLLDTGFLSTATGTNQHIANKLSRFGGEAALVYGPFSAQGEYIQADISGKGYHNNNLNGAYGYMSYFLTGESRNYKAKTGAWDRIKPKQNFTAHGGLGAWEIAVGYDHLDLNSGVIQGGRASTGKVAINWYPNSRFRLMANFIHALDLNTANVGSISGTTTAYTAAARPQAFNNAHPDIFEIRGQLDF